MNSQKETDLAPRTPEAFVEDMLWKLGHEKPETRLVIVDLINYLRNRIDRAVVGTEKPANIIRYEYDPQVVAKNLKTLRRNKKLTQRQVAAQLNVTDKLVSQWETDGAISEKWFAQLAQIFEVEIAEILTPMPDK